MKANKQCIVGAAVVLVAMIAGSAFAGFRIKNNTSHSIEVNVTFIHWGHEFTISETGWHQLKPNESFDPDPGHFGLGKIYFVAAKYVGGPKSGSFLPVNAWRRYDAGKFSIAIGRAHFDPESRKAKQLNSETVLEEIKKGNWTPLKKHWPEIRMISSAAKVMPLTDAYGSFQIEIFDKRCAAKIWRQEE